MSSQIIPIQRQSLSESLYRQMKDFIATGAWVAGQQLPSERMMSLSSGMNRNAVREAVKRLQQAGLIAVHQGGNHTVLDYRREAGLDLLPSLLVNQHGQLNAAVLNNLMGMRTALAPCIAAEAAENGGQALANQLDAVLVRMRQQRDRNQLAELQQLALDYWQLLVDACGNVAYQLAFNALRKTYLKAWSRLTQAMAPEFEDVANLEQLACAVRGRDPQAARDAATRHVRLGQVALAAIFALNESPP